MKISDEQIERANLVNLPEFLMMHGFALKKAGKDYIWKEHDSLHIKDNGPGERGQWFRFSENKGGDNIGFLREYMNMSFAEAVEALTGEHIERTYTPSQKYQPKSVQQPARELSLAEADNRRRVFAYLCQTRGLDYDLLSPIVRQGMIAQEEKTGNILFKYFDETGKLIGAEKVGTSTEHKFKGIATGSASGHGFEIVRGSGVQAFFFESAIDLLSYLQMNAQKLDNCRLVSMMGVKPNIVLDTMIRNHIKPEDVFLCSDNDTAGNEFADRLRADYPQMRRIVTPDLYKDWNDMLRGIPKTELKKEVQQTEMKTYGNEIWHKATDNREKNVVSVSAADFLKLQEQLENAGINYYGYARDNSVYIALNATDTMWFAQIAGVPDIGPQQSAVTYIPPEKNIFGNTEYRAIQNKEYLSADRDLVLKMAEILNQRGISFSGRVYPTGKGTLTVSHNDLYTVRGIRDTLTAKRIRHGAPERGVMMGSRDVRSTYHYLSKYTPEQFKEMLPYLNTNVRYQAVANSGKVAFAVEKDNAPAFHRALENAEREVGMQRNMAALGLPAEQMIALTPFIHRLAVEDMQLNLTDFFDSRYDEAQFGEMLSLVNAYLAQSPAERYGEHSKLSEMLEAKSSFDRSIELSDFFSQHDFSDDQRAAITAMFVGDVTRGQIDSIDETFTAVDIQAYDEILHHALQQSDVADYLAAHQQTVIDRENAARVPTEEEVLFPEADLARFLAERTLSSDEWEDMAYPLFDRGYLEKHQPSEKGAFGYHLTEPALYDLAKQYRRGEDIRRELANSLLEGSKVSDIEFVFEDGRMSDSVFYYADDQRHTLHTEKTDDGYLCSFAEMERFVSFEEIGQAFLDRTHEEFDDLAFWWVRDEIRSAIPDISDETIRNLLTAFDAAVMSDWEKGDNKPRIQHIKKALYGILGDTEQTEKAFSVIAKEKYHVSFQPEKRESPIHFGMLGNGITAYDTSRTDPETNDYPTVAHISPEGVVTVYDDTIPAEDMERIRQQAQTAREQFMRDWNSLTSEQQLQKLLDRADTAALVNMNREKLHAAQIVEKYMPFVIFKEGERPEPEPLPATFRIYQLPAGEQYHSIRFESMEQLKKDGIQLSQSDYEMKYEGTVPDFRGRATLEEIYTRFNENRPEDFRGHSLSISDVVVISFDGKDTAYYCDTFGYVEMPNFFKEKERVQEHSAKVSDLAVGDIIMYEDKLREVEQISEKSIMLKDMMAPEFGGVLLGTSDVLAYEGWQQDMERKGFEVITKAERKEPAVDVPEQKEPEDKGPVSLRKVGDFYEMYGKNAEIGAEVLGPEMHTKHGSPMAGFPADRKTEYSAKLKDAGYTVLIEQAFELNPPKRESEKLQTLQQVVDTFFGTDCESAETERGTWKLAIADGDKVGELFYGGDPVCGIYNRGDKMEIEPYRELSTFPELLQTAMLEHNPDKPVEIMEYQRAFETPLDKAKWIINDFCEAEYREGADFSDLHHVGLAFTTLTDDELPIQVMADLVDFKITYEFDGEVYNTEQYCSIEDMIENGLTGLDFSDLISVPDDVIGRHTGKGEQTVDLMSDAADISDTSSPAEDVSADIDKPLFTDDDVIEEIQRDEKADVPFWEKTETQSEQLTLFGDSVPVTLPKTDTSKRESANKLEKQSEELMNALADEIRRGTGFVDGKFRVQDYYDIQHPTVKELAGFLKKEYGVGGHSSDGNIQFVDHDSKGIRFSFADNEKAVFSWTEVAAAAEKMLQSGTYLSEEEKAERAEKAARQQNVAVGDQFRHKVSGEISEVVSLTGALPFYTDDCTVRRMSGAFSITENISYDKLLNSSLYEYIGRAEPVKAESAKSKVTPDKPAVASDTVINDISTIKNLSQLKKAIKPGMMFEITDHLRPECIGERRIVTGVSTVDFTSRKLDENGEPIGKDLHMDFDRAKNWSFDRNDMTSRLEDGSVLMQFHFIDGAELAKEADRQAEVHEVSSETADIEAPTDLSQHDDLLTQMFTVNPSFFKGMLSDETIEQQEQVIKNAVGTISHEDRMEIFHDLMNESNAPESTADIAMPLEEKAENYTITDDILGEGGAKTRFRANVDAIWTLQALEAEKRPATAEEKEILSRYVGWGSVPQAFDKNADKWSAEYKELAELLTPEEYRQARATVGDAFYTSMPVIDGIYEALRNFGFNGGAVLEPAMGVGNFFGRMPDDLKAASDLYGVEIDSISGRIAQALYPEADIAVQGFERNTFQNGCFDVAVGNVPFGDLGFVDTAHNTSKLHDFFFCEALDKIKNGGILAFVTSAGTLDKRDESVRQMLADKADLIGAIRLPGGKNGAFKENAGTEVTADIIFLKKHEGKSAAEMSDVPDWVHIGETVDGLPINKYFEQHPEMVLGTVVEGNKLYGSRSGTMVIAEDGFDLKSALHEAVSKLSAQISQDKGRDIYAKSADGEQIQIPFNLRNYSFFLSGDKVYFKKNNAACEFRFDHSTAQHKRFTAFIALRDLTRELLEAQELDKADSVIKELQEKLNAVYDDFYKKYGLIHSQTNKRYFSEDVSYNLVAGLEKSYDKTELKEKSDIFFKRTIVPPKAVEHVETALEALTLSVAEKARVDFDYMRSLTGMTEDELKHDLTGEIFKIPHTENGYLTASEYLSGDIRKKLLEAEEAAEYDADFNINVSALKQAMPEPLKAGDIDVKIGATWLDTKYYEQFIYELLQTPEYQRSSSPVARWNKGAAISVEYSEHTNSFHISNKASNRSVLSTQKYGSHHMNAYEIFEHILNLQEPKIYTSVEVSDGLGGTKEKRIVDMDATRVVQRKAEDIRKAFKDWIFRSPERREAIVQRYNELFNSIRPREYDGSHLSFPLMTSEISLHDHQKNAIAHALFGGNTLFAHAVGAGKTFEMIAAALESKRLGLCTKSLFAVPNHLTEQIGDDFQKLYPSANILVATKRDFQKANRQQLFARIATGNYEAVIIGHSQLGMIPISKERQIMTIQAQIDDILHGIEELKKSEGSRFQIKAMERSRKALQKQLEKLEKAHQDDTLTFEQLGIDRLFIDEMHEFKNLFTPTKLQNVSGISNSASQKALDLFLKVRYLDEKTGGRGLIGATGTPLSNSVTELHTMMRYLEYDFLKEHGLQNFDNWVSVVTQLLRKLFQSRDFHAITWD